MHGEQYMYTFLLNFGIPYGKSLRLKYQRFPSSRPLLIGPGKDGQKVSAIEQNRHLKGGRGGGGQLIYLRPSHTNGVC